jgi:dCTP deaminase
LPNQSVVEDYALEIVARVQAGRARCKQLVAADFVSDAPRNLIQALQNTFEHLAKAIPAVMSAIDWAGDATQVEKDINVLRVLDNHAKVCASHIRYVESARTERLPWQIIPSFERLVRHLKPGAQVMLRPMWKYNYSTMVTNLRDFYLSYLRAYEFYLPDIDVESVLAPLGSAFHIISFPALERDNILLHSLLGHEIGHLIADSLVKADAPDFLARALPEIEKATENDLANKPFAKAMPPLIYSSVKAKVLAENSRICLFFWSRALEEILSDIVGAILFGPAALFSTLELAIQFGFDLKPSSGNEYYPPWRTRIREVFTVVSDIASSLLNVDATLFKMESPLALGEISSSLGLTADKRADLVNARVQAIKEIAASDDDKAQIDKDDLSRIAYAALRDYIVKHTASIKALVGKMVFNEKGISTSLPPLIERLDAGITPNAIHDIPYRKSTSVGIVEVLNSAWYHKTSLSVSANNTLEVELLEGVRGQRNRLTLKSIEYVFLSQSYQAENKSNRLAAPPAASAKPSSTTGVLTSEDLQNWMAKSSILERLIITPLFNPKESIGEAALDVRLGTEFVLFRKETFQALDVTSAKPLVGEVSRYRESVVRRIREPFVLHPGQLVIGSTLEYVQMPPRLIAYVVGKSTWGRTGLIIATATKVDPGFRGCITLEIVNEGEVPLVLLPGLPIAQLVFHITERPVSYSGVYNSPIGPEFPRFEKLIQCSSFWLPKTSKRKK